MGKEGKGEEKDRVPQFRKNELQSRNSHNLSLSLSLFFNLCKWNAIPWTGFL
jgi:hypothetical protein